MRRAGVLRLADRFELRRRLGEGAMGVVYEALDRRRNSVVALKTLTRIEGSAIYHLKNEFRSIAGLVHPNLVSLHELFAAGDNWFITMDLVAGVPFVQHVRGAELDFAEATLTMKASGVEPLPISCSVRSPSPQAHGGRADEVALRDAFGQLVEGVLAIHGAGKLHRDLKPSNVLVNHEGRVKILDFGLVIEQATDALQSVAGSIEGTPAYMAPEQARGDRLTPESDWYAVGVILYETLTGRWPFWGVSHQVLREKQHRLPMRPDQVVSGLPEDLVDLCMSLLSIEPSERPSGAAILTRLSKDSVRSSHVRETVRVSRKRSQRPALFVGREQQLRQLAQALDDTERGAPVIVRLPGLSGMGKTGLLRQFGALARRQHSAVVLEGRCYARESVPYKGVDGLIDALTRYLRRLSEMDIMRVIPRHVHALSGLFPVLNRVEAVEDAPIRRIIPVDMHERRRNAISALGEMLSRINDEYPLVLMVDDFQWADADSVALLRELLSLREAPSCLVVLAYRSDEVERSEGLHALERFLLRASLDVRTIEVGPLGPDDVRELGRHLGSAGLDTEALWRESQGSPYFVHELMFQATADPESLRKGHIAAVSLDAALRRRISQLDVNARRLLDLVCVSGRPVPADVLRVAACLQDETDLLRTLSAESLVRVSASAAPIVEIYHERVRDSVTENLEPEEVRALNARLGEVLEDLDGDPEPLAEHFLAAGQLKKAFQYSVLAAERALDALAFERAASFCRVALELLPPEKQDQEAVFRRTLASALAMAGRSLEAAQVYKLAAAQAHGGEAARLKSLSAVQMLLGGRLREGVAGVKASLAAYGLRVPDDPAAQHAAQPAAIRACERAVAPLLSAPAWRDERTLSIEERTRLDVIHTGPLGLYGLDLSPLGTLLAAYDARASLESMDPARCLRSLSLLKSLIEAQGRTLSPELSTFAKLAAARLDDPMSRAWQEFNGGVTAYWNMEARSACDALKRAERLWSTECYGVMRLLGIVRLKIAVCQRIAGRVNDLAADCEQWRRSAHERGDFFTELWMTILGPKSLCAGDVAAARRDREAALAHLEALDDARSATPGIIDAARMAAVQLLAEVDWYEGRPHNAWRRLEPHLARGQSAVAAPVVLHRRVSLTYRARGLTNLLAVQPCAPLFQQTAGIAEELKASQVPGLCGFGWSVSAALAQLQHGSSSETAFHLRTARDCFAGDNPTLFHCAGLQLGAVLGHEEGRRLEADSEAALRAEGIAEPRRWARMELPVIQR